jgi:succinylglutamate desuccinylase
MYSIACKNSKVDGPTSVIMAGVHGNERCGIDAITEFLFWSRIDFGTVYFIVGNPRATNKMVRFTEMDLNRCFAKNVGYKERQTYEYCRAEYLKHFFDRADALLDIHSSDTIRSPPFVICEENALPLVRMFPVEIMLSGMDKVCPGGTDEYMNRTGKIGICLEAGHHNDASANEIAVQSVCSFLHSRGHIRDNPAPAEGLLHRRVQVREIYHSKTSQFRQSKKWAEFEKVRCDEVIGFDGGDPIVADHDAVIIFPEDADKAGKEIFYLGREI